MKTILTLLVILLVERTLLAEKKELYFPPAKGEWERIEPTQAGWDTAKLKQALDYAERQKSSAIVILAGGKLITEQYWNCLLYTSPSPRDATLSRMPSSA